MLIQPFIDFNVDNAIKYMILVVFQKLASHYNDLEKSSLFSICVYSNIAVNHAVKYHEKQNKTKQNKTVSQHIETNYM